MAAKRRLNRSKNTSLDNYSLIRPNSGMVSKSISTSNFQSFDYRANMEVNKYLLSNKAKNQVSLLALSRRSNNDYASSLLPKKNALQVKKRLVTGHQSVKSALDQYDRSLRNKGKIIIAQKKK